MAQLYDTYPHKHTTKGGQEVVISAYMPDRYPQGVGTNYIGEVEGYTYIPAMNAGRGGYREGGQGTPEDPNAPGPSTWDQVKPVAAVGGAFALGNAAMKPGGIKEIASNITSIPNQLYSWGKGSVEEAKGLLHGLTGGGEVAGTAASSSIPAGYAVASDGVTLINTSTGAAQVGTAVNGGALMSDGSVVGGEASGLFGSETMAAAAPYVLPAIGAGILTDTLMKDRGKGSNSIRGGLAGGIAAAPWAASLGPWGMGAAILGGGLLGLGGGGMLNHKSTKEYQAERRNALINAGVTGYEDFMKQIDPSKDPNYGIAPDMNALTPEQVWGTQGVFDTFRNDWFGKYSEDDRREISRRLIEANMFKSDKGDLIIHSDNQAQAKQIAADYEKEKGMQEEEEEDQNV